MKRKLVAYFSATGTTAKVAENLADAIGADILDHQFSGAALADNIVSLCHKCHTNVHNGKMDILKF